MWLNCNEIDPVVALVVPKVGDDVVGSPDLCGGVQCGCIWQAGSVPPTYSPRPGPTVCALWHDVTELDWYPVDEPPELNQWSVDVRSRLACVVVAAVMALMMASRNTSPAVLAGDVASMYDTMLSLTPVKTRLE